MKLRALTAWRTRSGKRRTIRLYKAWNNLRGRVNGTCTRADSDYWLGLSVGFREWEHFRAWALQAGYSKIRCSLDRIDSTAGYFPANLRWVTVSENATWANYTRWKAEKDSSESADVSG